MQDGQQEEVLAEFAANSILSDYIDLAADLSLPVVYSVRTIANGMESEGISVTLDLPWFIPQSPDAATIPPDNGQLILDWSPVDGSSSYEVWYSNSPEIDSALKLEQNTTDHTAVIEDPVNQSYYICVKAKNRFGSSDFGPVVVWLPTYLPILLPTVQTMLAVVQHQIARSRHIMNRWYYQQTTGIWSA
jgi:hypothetical protein